jgi:catechol 1,2-dioxygenase
MNVSRRELLRQGLGIAALGAVPALVLPARAQTTPASGSLGNYASYVNFLDNQDREIPKAPDKLVATADNILGPYYREGVPFRAKVTPPLEPGTVLHIKGRVWGIDTRKPLVGVVIDIWQANAKGRYDNDDPDKPPAKDFFVNRTRLVTDETGYYEYESIHPAPYQTGPKSWRPSHVHYLVRHPGYKQLVTQMYFKGDLHNKADDFIKESLIIEVENKKVGTASYEAGNFDIVLEPKK